MPMGMRMDTCVDIFVPCLWPAALVLCVKHVHIHVHRHVYGHVYEKVYGTVYLGVAHMASGRI